MPDDQGNFKGTGNLPELPWKRLANCDACDLQAPRDELVPVTYADHQGETEHPGYLCESCATEAGL